MKRIWAAALLLGGALAGCSGASEDSAAPEDSAAAEEQAAGISVPSGTYLLDQNHKILQFRVPHGGLSNYHVRFTDVDATLELDSQNLENSSIRLSVPLSSVDPDYPGDYAGTHTNSEFGSWSEALATRFLGGDNTPVVTFVSTAVEETGPNAGQVTGNLTLNGVTRPVTLQVRLVGQRDANVSGVPALGFEAEGRFEREQFGFQPGPGPVGSTVELYFNGEFVGESEPAPADAAQTPAD